MWSSRTRQLIEIALEEDLGAAGDITSALLPHGSADVAAIVRARAAGVVCGMAVGGLVCDVFAKHLGQPLAFVPAADAEGREQADGDAVAAGDAVATVRGSQAAVLAVERTLLNFVGRMSGVATLTRRYVEAALSVNPQAKIVDTRKTVPGWRELDKYAVRVGGGRNHRMGLYDAVLIKDNHLTGIALEDLAETLAEWIGGGWSHLSSGRDGETLSSDTRAEPPAFTAVEVDTLEQFYEVCKVPAVDIVLLDNFGLTQIRAAVRYRDKQSLRGKLALEASGGVTLAGVKRIAATGVDRISIGALTHSAPALDLGMDF